MSQPYTNATDTLVEQITIHNRVAVLRKGKRISRKELAELLRINHRTLGLIEQGDQRINLELAYRIARYFGLPLEAVFSDEPLRPLGEYLPGGEQDGYDREDAV